MPFDGRQNYLNDDQIRAIAPSVFAPAAAPTTSDRYAYISTFPIIEQLRKGGFEVSKVREGKKRAPEGREYALHEVRLQQVDSIWSQQTKALGQLTPELIIHNSHDRTSGFKFMAGIMRLVCLNGMTVADHSIADIRIRHTGNGRQQQVTDAAFEVRDRFGAVIEKAQAWSQISLSPTQRETFAKKALEVRGTAIDVSPIRLLEARRFEDKGFNLWNTFNVLQENLTHGGARGRSANGGRRTLRAVGTLSADIDLNRKLWAVAEEFATAVA